MDRFLILEVQQTSNLTPILESSVLYLQAKEQASAFVWQIDSILEDFEC